MQRQQQSVGAIDFYVRQFVCKNHNIVKTVIDLDDLERLYKLKQDGVVTEEEFNKAKTMLFKQLDVNETSPKKTPKKQKKTNDAVSADGGAK